MKKSMTLLPFNFPNFIKTELPAYGSMSPEVRSDGHADGHDPGGRLERL